MTSKKYFAPLLASLVSFALCLCLSQAQSDLRARVIHVAAGKPAIDVYLNGALAAADLSYGESSASFRLPAGEVELQARIAGAASKLMLQAIDLESDASVIVLGSNADEPVHIIADDLSPLEFGMTRLLIVNALADGSGIDILATADERLNGEDIGPGSALGALDMRADQVDFGLLSAGADGETELHDISAALPAGTSNLLIIHGGSDDPQLLHAARPTDAEADGRSGRVRFVHAVQGAAPIDLKIDDHMMVPSLAFGKPSEHIALPSGSHQLTLSLGGTIIASSRLELSAGQMHTVAILGSPALLKPYAYEDSLQDLNEASTLVNLINAVPNSSVSRLRLESGAIVAADVGYGEAGGAAQIVPGKQAMSMNLEIGDDTGTVEVPPRTFYPGSYYNLIALSGSAFTAPRLLIAETSLMRRLSAASPMSEIAAQDNTEAPEADSEDSEVQADEPDTVAQADETSAPATATDADATAAQESATEAEETGEPAADLPAGPSIVAGPYAIINLDPDARLQLRQYPSSDALSLGLLPGETELIVLGRRGVTEILPGETTDLPIDLGDFTVDPAASLFPAQDLRQADTWLFVMYQTEDRGSLVGWVNAYYLQVYDETGESQRLASLPTVRQNRAGSSFNTDMQPPALADHVSARVYGLNANALLNVRVSNNPDSEVMLQLAPDSELTLIGFDEEDAWAFVDYAADTGNIVRGWVSADYVQVLLNGEPALVDRLRALDETVAPHISDQARGSVRSSEASGPTPIPLPDDMMKGIVGEVALDPGAMLHLRQQPDLDAESLALIPAGTKVAISGITANAEWLKTSYADREGWIAAHYITLLLRGRQYHRAYVESLLPAHDNQGNSTG